MQLFAPNLSLIRQGALFSRFDISVVVKKDQLSELGGLKIFQHELVIVLTARK